MNKLYKVEDEEFDNELDAYEYAWRLLQDGVEWVTVLIWNEDKQNYGLLQEFNLERGVLPNPHWNTWTFPPYFVKMKSLKQLAH